MCYNAYGKEQDLNPPEYQHMDLELPAIIANARGFYILAEVIFDGKNKAYRPGWEGENVVGTAEYIFHWLKDEGWGINHVRRTDNLDFAVQIFDEGSSFELEFQKANHCEFNAENGA
jgi:hypothetical protein